MLWRNKTEGDEVPEHDREEADGLFFDMKAPHLAKSVLPAR
jgi:hypothetical protein